MSDNELQAFEMWKIIHGTILNIFKNLENSEYNLRTLAKTLLNNKELSEIFVPNYDPSLSFEEHKNVENTYQAFTVWLLGRLFYLLSCNNLQRVHDLYIQLQQRILVVYKLKRPHIYQKLVNEYAESLTTVNNYIQNSNDAIFINHFKPDDIHFQNQNLELTSIIVQLPNVDSCLLLQPKILKIIVDVSLFFTDCGIINSTTKSILNNIVFCQQHSKAESKIIIVDYLNILIKQNYYEIKSNIYLNEHFQTLFSNLEIIITENNFNFQEKELFDIALSKLFDTIQELNLIKENSFILEKSKNMCEFLILKNLQENKKETLNSSMKLLTHILQFENNSYVEINKILNYISTTKRCEDVDILLQYQILKELKLELKDNFVDAIEFSSTWKVLYNELSSNLFQCINNKLDLNTVSEVLYFMKNLLHIAQIIYFSFREFHFDALNKYSGILQLVFFPVEDLLYKINRIINIYDINTSETIHCLDFIVDSLSTIISFTYFTQPKIQTFKNILDIICYPFSNLNKNKQLLTVDFSEDLKIDRQIKAINILSTCLLNVDSPEKNYTNDIKNGIVNILKDCKDTKVLMKVSQNFLYFLCTLKGSTSSLLEILKLLLNNTEVQKVLSEHLGKIVCVLSGYFIISPSIQNNCILYEVHCLKCDFTKKDDNEDRKLYRISDNKPFSASQFIVQKNFLPNDGQILNLLNSNDVDVKLNIVKQLPRFAKHLNGFNTIPITKQWLTFMEDENREIRMAFISVIKSVMNNIQNNKYVTTEYKESMLEVCLQNVKSATQQHIRSPNVYLIETLIDTINEFGCLNLDVLRPIVNLLIFYVILSNPYLSLCAIESISKIAKAHNLLPSIIFNKHMNFFCPSIAKMCVVAYLNFNHNITQSLERIIAAFGLGKDFFSRKSQYLMPYLVPCFVRAPESLKILNDFANFVMVESSELITSNFSYIYIQVYLYEDEQMFKNCLHFMEKTTGIRINVLKKRSIKVIHSELLVHLHEKEDLVLKELYKLSLEDDSSTPRSTPKSNNKNQQISEYIQPRFLGFLVYFDTKFISSNIDDSVKISILQSLPLILKLLGSKFVTSLRHKVLATLKTALSLTDRKFSELNCDNWNAFVHCCEVDSLGPLLSTIFVSILPLLEFYPRKINSIFKYLIIDNQETVKEYIEDLFFVTDVKVDNEIKMIIKKYVSASQNKSCKERLKDFLKYIGHENLEVRVHGLKFLKKYLEEKRAELEELVLGTNGMDEVLVELIDELITGCRENDEKVRLACGQCIGELGAIEPSHFPRKYATDSNSNFSFHLTDDVFITNSLMELLRSFQMETHTPQMNRCALAIQEMLKAYEISPNETARKHNLWNMFPENMQEIMRPLLSSRYTIASQSEENYVHPIFGSHLGSKSSDWMYKWTSYLISILDNDKKKFLEVCKPNLRYDFRTLMVFLPLILVHALLESSDESRQKIFEEFMAVLDFSDGQRKIDPNLKKYQKLQLKSYVASKTVKKSDDTNKSTCVKVIFILLDYLDRWLREYECQKCLKLTNPLLDVNYKKIHTFMGQFCKLKIAKCNFLRGEFPRALMYLERHVSEQKNLKEHLGFFARIYGNLEEPDGVAGAMAIKQTDPSIEDMILAHNVSGQLQDAIACYERMAQESTLQPQHLQDMIRCYLEADNPFTALNVAKAALETYPEQEFMLYECQAEPYWRLGMYDELTDLLQKPEIKNNNSWGVKMGRALVHFRNGNRVDFQNEINSLQKMLVEMLSFTSLEEGIYRHGYPHIIKLHILNELQRGEEVVYRLKDMSDNIMCERIINELDEELDLRLKVVQSSVRVIEPILRVRRIILEQTQHLLGSQSESLKVTLNKHIAKYWLKSAEIARKSSIFQQAYIYILKAEQYKSMELFIEKAKLYWAREDQDLAFSTLKRGVEEYFPDAASFKEMDPSFRKIERKLCAEAKLLIATYNDETSNVDMDVNITNYREAVDTYREWEKSQVCLAQYYDRVFSTMSDEDRDIKGGEIQIHIINCFGKSLQYGSTYIYQSMPRMLSIWCDYGTRIVESRPTDTPEARDIKKNNLFKMIKLIDTYLDRLPAYMFLSAFSQLVSRICHPVREVYMQIKSILIKLILKYPQQSMWNIMSISKSSYVMRSRRCQEILQDERIKNSRYMKLVLDFNRLAEKLIELCNKPISDGVVVASVQSLCRGLVRILGNGDFSQIMMPVQKMRKLILPNPEYSNSQYNPFPHNMVYIVNIEDQVKVLQSLQRPRQITLLGSDGKKYIHMLKPKDDLRKDQRLMEFNDVVNLYLHREAESRQRRLCIRTYSVVPLNEECGIIEWIDNLVGLRPILMKIYKQKGIYVSPRELKAMMCNVRDPLSKKREVFEKQLLPRHPPVLSEWFRRTFPDAHCWFHARTAYVRTSAVFSMVGYILGLGDRHGENILFDSTNGDIMHVDFNCLFNKGETFDWPERVPFRLTQNMVEAMGPLGVEGIFRRTCAVTLRVLRTHTDTLMSIVRPFVYDPLLSWPRNQLIKPDVNAEAERTNEQAVEHIRNIELRLQGVCKTRGKSFSISLSCEGQANNLIAEATSIDNLSQMYIGWGPYL